MCFYDNSSCSPCSEALSSDHCSQMRQQYHCISNSFTKISWNVVVVDCKTSQHTLSALYGDNINDMSAVTGVDGALCRCMNGHFISQKKTAECCWHCCTLDSCRWLNDDHAETMSCVNERQILLAACGNHVPTLFTTTEKPIDITTH